MTPEELLSDAARVLREVEPSACLVLPRVLRRVIKEHGEFGGMALHVPHRKCYLISRERLLWHVSPDELAPSTPPTDRAILIAHPDEQEFEGMSRGQLLRELWRTLFHARVHAELDSELAVGRLTPEVVHARIDRIGQAEFDEVVAVLRHENFLLSPHNITANYIEFAAVWSELRFFSPDWLENYFPAIHDPAHIDAVLAEDLDGAALFAATRLPGAADPADPAAVLLEPSVRGLLREADEASTHGNAVRAALLRTQAGAVAPPGYADETARRANEDLDRLVSRLQAALRFPDEQLADWRTAVGGLLNHSRRGFWDADKRLLYDLQNVCVDHERDLFVLDPLPWLFTLGGRPLRRKLPHLRNVLVTRHLRRAQVRLTKSQLDAPTRERLAELLRSASHDAEHSLRREFRPILAEALHDAGLEPQNLPERVALSKIVEELLDVIVERGFLTMGILRDALSRNNLKLPDFPSPGAVQQVGTEPRNGSPLMEPPPATPFVRGDEVGSAWEGQRVDENAALAKQPAVGGNGEETLPAELAQRAVVPVKPAAAASNGSPAGPESWWSRVVWTAGRGLLALCGFAESTDPLLRINRRLSTALDGVYRRAEVYLRVLQGVSALAFGTPLGRFLTKYVVLPIGGAYVILEGLQHMVHMVQHYVLHMHVEEHQGVPMPNGYAWAGLALFLFGMLHIPPFRTIVVRHVLLAFYHLLKGLVYDIPRWALKLPWVHRIVFSRTANLLRRFLVTPLLMTGLVWLLFPLFLRPFPSVWWFVGVLAAIAVLLNSRVGRDVEELSAEAAGRWWYRVRVRVFVAMFELVMDTFKQIMEAFERVLYAVDEWLRFRSGESTISLALKAALGVVWAAVNYVLRFLINLVAEPQINPIKHFPVVTVSHKIILPLLIWLGDVLSKALGQLAGWLVAGSLQFVIPGIFGFLVWELKENWRLYAANRRRYLSPVMIGHHGESMIRLMKPGLHSGTLPRLYSRLRRALRKSYLARNRVAITRYHEDLHHLEERLRYFFDRELFALLSQSRSWGSATVSVGELHLAASSIRAELRCPELGEHGLWLTFEEQAGWLLAEVSQPGWLANLSGAPRKTFEIALLGTYKLAGVDLIREDIAGVFSPENYPYDLREQQIVVWPDEHFAAEVHYNLDERPARARPRSVARLHKLPDIDPHQLLFSRREIAWVKWVAAWSCESLERGPGEIMADPPRVLPHRDANSAVTDHVSAVSTRLDEAYANRQPGGSPS